MARGGRRIGAGRPAGSGNKASPELREIARAHSQRAFERVLTLVQPQQIGMGKFTIQNTGPVQGQTIGDQNTITQTFGNPPKA